MLGNSLSASLSSVVSSCHTGSDSSGIMEWRLELLARVGPLSHGEVAHLKSQQWILEASRCGHGQKRILFL